MEPSNFPVISKKFWRFVMTALLMLKKGMALSKTKLMLDLSLLMQRGKLAGKAAIHSLMLIHHSRHHLNLSSSAAVQLPEEYYEFSCSNSPAYHGGGGGFHLPFPLGKKSKNRHAAATFEDIVAANAVVKALEILHTETPSPALPGFGRTPVVRQLRITDSPFPVKDGDESGGQVDRAAEDFISQFYRSLRRQSNDD
ncbi:unnamed protein product [Cuscuta epithymum]|uniref:Avr9/Cf-9 rapidly elicited protein 146 n=1 Tax=Cuscuta epithymum TaxID=186058 RepID=A0AAV0C6F8_9ASTE|nr:unnamed protein product [Cuscuta epithymum]